MKSEMSDSILPVVGGTRARWMVVDDSDAVLDFLASLLENLGIADVHRFSTATEALTAFSAAPGQFQFVITDLEMPGMNGIEFCRRLHSIAPGLKIVLATGSAAATEEGARRCGFSGLLLKPFPAAALWRMLETAGVMPAPALN
jgi:CheY-like chemotaxis protein